MANASGPESRRIVGIFAHPDDEIFCAGGTLARYASEGATVTVVSATRGEAGQIRDAAVATRATLGRVRQRELELACYELGVSDCRFFDHRDGTLPEVDPGALVGEVAGVLRDIEPDVVITFGNDGAYGHPDHVTVSDAVTEACAQVDGIRLYHSHFPRSRMLILDRLATWLVELSTRFKGSIDFVHALSIFAQETTTLGYASDHVDVLWFPAGSYIIEQGEAATSLYLIISGEAEVIEEIERGGRRTLARRGPGEFVGELGVAYGKPRMANVIAVDSVTCLVFTFSPPQPFDGRGADRPAPRPDGMVDTERYVRGATTRIDVGPFVHRKVAALAAHRSQYPIDTDMFPDSMLTEMFGTEYFVRVLPPPELEAGIF